MDKRDGIFLNGNEEEAQHKPRTSRRINKLANVLRQRQEDLTVVLSNIHDPHNVSAIYRSCDAFGVGRVHLHYTNTAFPALGRKSSASARKWVETTRHADAAEMFAFLRGAGFQILATSFSDAAKPLRQWDFLRPTAIIFGNEHSGVEEELLRLSDGQLYIPMHGMIQSLNVSVAAAVVLAEAARQREDKGYYERAEPNGADFQARLANWLEK